MGDHAVRFSVFTKPWPKTPLGAMAKTVRKLGFDGLEFPLRTGYQIEPETAEEELPKLVATCADFGLEVFSVASSLEEYVFAGCAAAGIPLIRVMTNFKRDLGYWANETALKTRFTDEIIPLCEKYGVQVGVQMHYDYGVSTSMELHHLVEPFDPQHIGAIWDAGHSALAGEEPEQGLDIVWSHLCMVHLKNAFYQRITGPEAQYAKWKRYLTSGWQGMASWARAANYLKERHYQGVVCLTANYDVEEESERLIAQDIIYAKSLF